MRVWMTIGVAFAAMLTLTACGNGDSAVESRDRTADVSAISLPPSTGAATSASDSLAEKTAVTANRRETVDEKVQRLYERNGSDFDAQSAEDFLDKVARFTSRPPPGTETATRPNGDTLLYQPSTNTFAVVARDGTARTMFKPDDGAAYWAEQKAAAPTFGQRQSQN